MPFKTQEIFKDLEWELSHKLKCCRVQAEKEGAQAFWGKEFLGPRDPEEWSARALTHPCGPAGSWPCGEGHGGEAELVPLFRAIWLLWLCAAEGHMP